MIESPVKDYIHNLKSTVTKKSFKFSSSGVIYFGKEFQVKSKWKNDLALSDNSACYRRIFKDNYLFSSHHNTGTLRSNNSIALTDEGYFQLVEFLVDFESGKEFAICNKINTVDAFASNVNSK